LIEERDKLSKRLPILVKIAPDLNDSDLEDIAKILIVCKI
jgi:dihydroorotate dehydrogenase